MWFRSLLESLKTRAVAPSRRFPSRPNTRLWVEALDDRCLPSTFTVTNLLDGGAGSLRAAVVAANANPGADAVDFATTGTIALTSGQLDITDSVTINGPGAGALTVSGEGISRVFAIAGNPTVLIGGLTVSGGWTSGSPGGGISVANGTVTLDHVNVYGNLAVGVEGASGGGSGGNGAGGGIYVAGGTLTLDQCIVSWNAAVGGAGADGYVTGGDGGQGEGGGLYVAGGMVQLNQSTVSGNQAAGGNGGDSEWYHEFESYGGNGGWGGGGGIRVAGGSVQIHQSSIIDNSAVGGSGGVGTWYGQPNVGVGGGLNIDFAAPPLADLDTFTESNTINNYADFDPNISGPYSLNGSFVRTLAIGDIAIVEGNTGTTAAVFTVRLSAASTETVAVQYATADGSATAADNDYQTQSGTLTFAPGETSKTVTVLVNGDRLGEPVETFVVSLTEPTNAVITDGQGVGTLVDDEPRIGISDVTRWEGNTGTTLFAFTVSLSAAYDAPVTVNFATANSSATAGSDYQATSGTLTIPAGQTTGTITVLVNGDRLAEPNEMFTINLSNPVNAGIADGQGVGNIEDDEPRVNIYDVARTEGNTGTTPFVFTVRLWAAYDIPVTVSFATANGSATAGSDYQAASGTLTIPAGQTTGTITVLVNGDRLPEPNETFFVTLSNLNYGFADSSATGTILNDEPRISIGNVAKAEGRKNHTTLFTFTVTLSAAYDQAVTVSFRTVDGTATTSDSDYVAKTGTLTFVPGETTKTVTITVKGDTKREADEYFYLDLFGNSSNSLFINTRGIGTILNDD